MTGDEFKQGLKAIGWKQADMCRKLSLNKSTVSTWATEGPPAWAAEYLRTLIRLHRMHEDLINAPPLERIRGMPGIIGTDRIGTIAEDLGLMAEMFAGSGDADAIAAGLRLSIAQTYCTDLYMGLMEGKAFEVALHDAAKGPHLLGEPPRSTGTE